MLSRSAALPGEPHSMKEVSMLPLVCTDWSPVKNSSVASCASLKK